MWIELCKEVYQTMSWTRVVVLIRRSHLEDDPNLIEKEIDLAYGAKDINVSILSIVRFEIQFLFLFFVPQIILYI